MLLLSMIPVGILGIFFKDYVELFFNGNTILVGCMLLITAILLALAHFIHPRQKQLTFVNTFIVGIAQAIAVLPGLSRSGATISTGLLLGLPREEVAKFSFLMVIIPVLGESFLDLIKGGFTSGAIELMPMITGFIAAFISGLFACKFMIKIVNKGNLLWFSLYCIAIGITAIIVTIY
jgi:undecaprenyl-diphosphatase